MGLLHDFVRLQWQNLVPEETGIIKSTILNHLISNPDSRQVPRISAEIAIREWPQQWPELTNILTSESETNAIPLIRLFGDIQFHINNQNIPNLQRQKDLSKGNVGRVFPMVIVSTLPHVELGRNDHREDAPHFST